MRAAGLVAMATLLAAAVSAAAALRLEPVRLTLPRRVPLLAAQKSGDVIFEEFASAGSFPCGDELDWRVARLMVPAMLNFAIIPLVGAVDTFWVARMHSAPATAGQGAARQIFNSAFWIFSFLPSMVTPLVAKAHGAKDKEALQSRAGEALFIAAVMGLLGTALISGMPDRVLSIVLSRKASSWTYAKPFLQVRALTFLPAMLSTVGFAVFRGSLDVLTPLRISLIANGVNVFLDPFLMFNCGLGICGAAAATCVADVITCALYGHALWKRQLVDPRTAFRVPSLAASLPLLYGGVSIQLKSIALNTAMVAVTRRAQALDTSGVSAAAHTIAMQMFYMGSVASLALSAVANMVVPTERARHAAQYSAAGGDEAPNDRRALVAATHVANRLLMWSVVVGVALGAMQLLMLPMLSLFSPLPQVRAAARLPTVIGAALQVMNCVVWTGEGVQQGLGHFTYISLVSMVATGCMMLSLRLLPASLWGIWLSFAVLSAVRLTGLLLHHFFIGPLAPRKIRKLPKDPCT